MNSPYLSTPLRTEAEVRNPQSVAEPKFPWESHAVYEPAPLRRNHRDRARFRLLSIAAVAMTLAICILLALAH